MNNTPKINDGGPAFPGQPLGADGLPMSEADPGMSLRDWFAGQALTGILIGSQDPALLRKVASSKQTLAEFVAETAYITADAMIAAREGGAQ